MPKNKDETAEEVQEDSEDEEHKEESELIEIIEKEQDDEIPVIDESGFREFLQSPTSSATPVLEEVTVAQEEPVFFTPAGGGASQTREGVEDDDPFKYANQGGNNDEDPQYVEMSTQGDSLERFDPITAKIETNPIQEAQRTYSPEAKGEDSTGGRLIDTRQTDITQIGRKETIEKEKEEERYWTV